MFKRSFFALAALIPTLGFCSSSLSFATPTIVPDSSLQYSATAPSISATASGFMLCWLDPSNNVIASFSTNLGASWSSTTVAMDSLAYPSIAGNQTGFVALWTGAVPGFDAGNVTGAFFDTTSKTWSDPISIDSPTDSDAPAFVASSKKGFIATWTVNYDAVYANVSTDGVTWQGSSSDIGTNAYGLASVSGCGNSTLFLVAWNDGNTNTIYVSTSANNGGTWAGPFTAVTDVVSGDTYGVGCFANEHGFLLAYGDESANIWSVFSSNGTDWGLPVLVGTDFLGGYAVFPSVAGTDAGFVIAWLGSDNNAYASLSEDNGTTWSSPPTAITSSGAVAAPPYFSSVNISAYNSHCMASWMESDGIGGYNAWVSLSPFPASSGSRKKNSGLFFPITPNKPGFQL